MVKSSKILMSACGVMITALSVGAFKFSAFGVDPFQSFMCGVDACFSLEFGTLYVIVNALLLFFSLAFDRHYIGIATFINLFLLGYVVEFSQNTLELLFPVPSLLFRAFLFLLGFLFLCFGSSLYMTADLGVSTYDAVALILSEKWKLGRFQFVRIATDAVCIVLGIALFCLGGGSVSEVFSFVGIGTVLTAFCMGPLIDLFNKKVSGRLLSRLREAR